jgi:hypothetical protein
MQPDNQFANQPSEKSSINLSATAYSLSWLGKIAKERVVANFFGLLDPEDRDRMIPRNVK